MEDSANQVTDQPAPGQGGNPAVGGPAPYDFEEAQRISAGQLMEWKQIQDRFGRDLAINLSALTRKRIKSVGAFCEQIEPGAPREQKAKNVLWIAVEAHPTNVWVALAMDSALVFALLEILLGGSPADENATAREVTEIELSVLQDLHGVIVGELEKAWRTVSKLTFQVVEQQAGRPTGRLAGAAGNALVGALDLEIEGKAGRMTLFFPAQIGKLLPGGGQIGGLSDAVQLPETTQQAIFERLKPAVLTLEGRLQGASVRLRDVMGLRQGDLLCLETPLEKPVDLLINGAKRFSGSLSDVGRKKAIRIHEASYPSKPGSL